MKIHLYIILTLLIVSISNQAYSQSCTQKTLVWSDEFNGPSINQQYWTFEIGNGCPNLCGWGNSELEYYTDKNHRFENGILIMEAKKESMGGSSFTSTRIITKNKFAHKYGRYESRMRMPKGFALWPAFWMLNNQKNNWPTSGEIDIMEYRGDITNKVDGTLHYGAPWPNNRYDNSNYTLPNGSLDTDFHVYAVEWTETDIKWYFDDVLYKTETKNPNSLSPPSNDVLWPWDDEFYIIFNFAVGGNYVGSPSADQVQLIKPTFEIDYVRVYDFTISNTTTPYNGKRANAPGKIEAENYDSGCQGIAFNDIDPQNQGNSYRTDGVDIEPCSDTDGGFNLGYTNDGEWLKYSINVLKSGTYNLTSRVAALNAGGKYRIEIDGIKKGSSMSISSTGGWQTWINSTIQNIPLTSGNHTLSFIVETGGFNLNHINITESVVAGIESQENTDAALVYPNPSKDLITIETHWNIASVKIYDMSGKLILKHDHHIIDISELEKGTYLIEIIEEGNQIIRRKISKN